MKIIRSIEEMSAFAHTLRSAGKRVGCIPTMGALHAGHLSLLALARERADSVVLSIFVNPTQFGPREDFTNYPRPYTCDCDLAEKAGCDVVFAPDVREMYPDDFKTTVAVNDITSRLCGASRPDHFEGVTTVVLKLFNIIRPHLAVFGAKDAQQVVVLRRMVDDLHVPVELLVGPIIREPDGLALSSRNAYLTEQERSVAPLIYQGITQVAEQFAAGQRDTAVLVRVLRERIGSSPLIEPEYSTIVDTRLLLPCQKIASVALVAVACRMQQSATRLIDNIVLGGEL